jgi:signal transduction histidine kinase
VRYFVEHALKHNGHHVTAVVSGEAALKAISKQEFDAAVIDLKMGGIEGLDVLAALRERTPDAAAIVLTGHGSMETAIEALRRGAHDYLLKPCDLQELRNSVGEALRQRHAARQQREAVRLVNDVSQEMRDPLASIEVNLQLLESGQPERRAHYLDSLRRATHEIEHLLENTLTLSQLRETPLTFAPEDLNGLLAQLIDVYHTRIGEDQLTLRFEPEEDLPPVCIDRDQVVRAFINLLANAINYTDAGVIDVRTGYDAQRDAVKCEITDTGVKIPPEELPHVFERFYRGSRASHSGSNGLGLFIAHEVVARHNGQLEVESAAGEGNTFRVWLPTQ